MISYSNENVSTLIGIQLNQYCLDVMKILKKKKINMKTVGNDGHTFTLYETEFNGIKLDVFIDHIFYLIENNRNALYHLKRSSVVCIDKLNMQIVFNSAFKLDYHIENNIMNKRVLS